MESKGKMKCDFLNEKGLCTYDANALSHNGAVSDAMKSEKPCPFLMDSIIKCIDYRVNGKEVR